MAGCHEARFSKSFERAGGVCVRRSDRGDAVSSMSTVKLAMLAAVFCFGFGIGGCTDVDTKKAAFVEKGRQLMASGDAVKARLEFKNALSISDRDAEIWFLLGQSELAAGKFKAAFNAYSRVVELDPTHIPALVKKGQILVGSGALEQAEEVLATANEMAPGDADALVLSAAIKKRRGDLAGAETDVRQALDKRPEHSDALKLLAMVQVANDDSTAAELTLQTAVAAFPRDTDFRLLLVDALDNLGKSGDAIDVVRGLIELKPDVADYRIRLARYLSGLGRSDEAETVLREAVSALPEATAVKLKLIEFFRAVRGLPRAIAATRELIAANPDDDELRLALGDLYIVAGEHETAESLYRDMIAAQDRSPASVRARIQLAAIYARAGKPEQAMQALDQALEVSAREPDALTLRATLVLRENPDQAIADLRTVLREYPDRAEVHELLAQAHSAKNEFALAQDAFEKAIELDPKRSSAFLGLAQLRAKTGDTQGALAVLNRLLETTPGAAKAREAIAQIQVSSSDWAALTATATELQRDQPDNPLGYHLAGVAAQQQNDHQGAVAAFEKALQRSPDAIEPLVALANSLIALKRSDEAEERVSAALQRNPSNLLALSTLGDLKAAAGQAKQAAEYYERALAVHSKVPRLYIRLASVLAGEGSLAEAVAVLERGVRETERDPALLFQLATTQDKRGDVEAAIAVYEELLQRFPDAPLAKNNLAMLYANHPQPADRLNKALQLAVDFKDHEVPAFRDTLGWVRYQRREYQLAADVFKSIVAEHPQMTETQYHLAMAYLKIGRTADTKKILERILAEDKPFPGRSDAEQLLARLAADA